MLSDALKGIDPNSRRHDVVTDIIENNDYKKLSDQLADKIRHLLWSYDGMSAKLRQELKNLGFVITDEGKHYKLNYYGAGLDGVEFFEHAKRRQDREKLLAADNNHSLLSACRI